MITVESTHAKWDIQPLRRKRAEEIRDLLHSNGMHHVSRQLEGRTDDTSMDQSTLYAASKRLFDLLAAVTLILIALPVAILVALSIYIDDGGPIFFAQDRIGQHGRRFRFLKFRSMVRDADRAKGELLQVNEASGPIFKMKHDPRVTRVGRFIRRYSLDELPQLLSVITGDMAMIGPRPLVFGEAAQCDNRQWRRHNVKPGVMCLREVCGRSRLSFSQWMELDLIYLDTRSIKTDVCVLLRACTAVLTSDGAY